MADHHHPEEVQVSLDSHAQEETFAGFIRVSVWVAGLAIAVLIFLALANS